MLSRVLMFGLCLTLSEAIVAPPTQHVSRSPLSPQTVVYWGQNTGNPAENSDLATYCTKEAGVDILLLSFLNTFSASDDIPSGTIGKSCTIFPSGLSQDCEDISAAISACQTAGVKVMLSLGGWDSSFAFTSDEQASKVGSNLWSAFGNRGNTSFGRPFGNVAVNGFDFDIERDDSGNQYFGAMINTLRDAFNSDANNRYYITGAPSCPLPVQHMGDMIGNASFDYLWVQWYNNNGTCALPFNGNSPFNYDDWVTYTASTESSEALLFVGVPASSLAATGVASGASNYIAPDQLSVLIGQYSQAPRFGGIMMWSAAFSDSNIIDGCTYAQQARSILKNGKACGGETYSPTLNADATNVTIVPTTMAAASSVSESNITYTLATYGLVNDWTSSYSIALPNNTRTLGNETSTIGQTICS